jgi:hypothetical protein
MKLIPLLIISGFVLMMAFAGNTHRRIQPKINRQHAEEAQRAESIQRGYDLDGLRRVGKSN